MSIGVPPPPPPRPPTPTLTGGQINVTAFLESGETVTLTVKDPNGNIVPMTSTINGNSYSATSNQTLISGAYTGTYTLTGGTIQKGVWNFTVQVP
jgi:hypothetical protein